MKELTSIKTVRLNTEKDALIILDQTRLPGNEVYLTLHTKEEIGEAIIHLKVRGAPAIGITGAYGLYICARRIQATGFDAFYEEFTEIKNYLLHTRPTAVNLGSALRKMDHVVLSNREEPVEEIKGLLYEEAEAIHAEDVLACHKIGEYGLTLLTPGMGILTHCNAGHLAVSEYGTALAPVYLGTEKGYNFHVFADETRPLLQGARLTAYELQRAGVDVTLICDSVAATVMQKGLVQAVLVGCDRVASNGDVANKVGTSALAVLANYYNIPFYVLGPSSTIDRQCPDGSAIIIEERKPEEVTELWYKERMAPKEVKVFNPAFDITPHSLITAIITNQGIHYPPYQFVAD